MQGLAELDPAILVALLGFGLAIFVVGYLVFVVDAVGRKTRERLSELNERSAGVTREVKAARLKKVVVDSRIPSLDRFVKHILPNRGVLRERLESTGRAIAVGDYVLACAALGGGAFVLCFVILSMPPSTSLAAGLAMGVGVPHIAVSMMIGRRGAKFNATFPEAIDLMVRALRSGLPIQEAIVSVGREMGGPVSEVFSRVMQEMKFGVQMEEAFWKASRTINTPELNFLIVSMSIQRETGGNLAETLANLGGLLRSRRQMKLKIRAFSSEARTTAMIIGALPFLIGGILFVMNPEYISRMFTDPRGIMMTCIGAASLGTGLFVMYRMSKFEV